MQVARLQDNLDAVVREEGALEQELRAAARGPAGTRKGSSELSGAPGVLGGGSGSGRGAVAQPLQALADGVAGYEKLSVNLAEVETRMAQIDKQLLEVKQKLDAADAHLGEVRAENAQALREKEKAYQDLRERRISAVKAANALQADGERLAALNYAKLDQMEDQARYNVNTLTNEVYKLRTECSAKQDRLRKMAKLVQAFRTEQEKRLGM